MLKSYELEYDNAKDNFLKFLFICADFKIEKYKVLKEIIDIAINNKFCKISNEEILGVLKEKYLNLSDSKYTSLITSYKKILKDSFFIKKVNNNYLFINKKILKDYVDNRTKITFKIKRKNKSIYFYSKDILIKKCDFNDFKYLDFLNLLFKKDLKKNKNTNIDKIIDVLKNIENQRIYNHNAYLNYFDYVIYDFNSKQNYINLLKRLVNINILNISEKGIYTLNRKLIPYASFLNNFKGEVNFNFESNFVNVKIDDQNDDIDLEELKDELELVSDEIQEILTGEVK